MQTSARRGISSPVLARTDAPDIPQHIANIINVLDLDVPWYTGTLAARPATGAVVQGSLYWATDNSTLYINTGTWTAFMSAASPALTGSPTAPTPAVGDNSTLIATTAFVRLMVPAGVIHPYPGAAAPSGWQLCDGSALNRTTFAALYAALGGAASPYGQGDGSTTFNVPDLRGRIPVGKNTATFLTLGAVGGEEAHALSIAELAAHTHTLTSDSAGTPAGTINSVSAGTPAGTLSSDSAGTPAGSNGNESVALTPSGTVVAASAGTPGGSVHSMFSGSGGAIVDAHISTSSTGLQAGDANAGDALLANTFTGSPMANHGHTFSGNQLPSHSHTFVGTPMGNHSHTFTGTAMGTHGHTFTGTAMGTHTHTVGSNGSGTAHNNLQPYIVLNYIIKT